MSEPAQRATDRKRADEEVTPRAPAPAPAPKPTLSPAPKPAPKPAPGGPARTPYRQPTRRLPAADDLLDPRGEPSLDGVDAAALTAIVGSYVRQIYGDLRQAHREAFAALHEPPPPADRSFALVMLQHLVGALAAYATGGLASLVFRSVEDKLSSDARASLSRSLSIAAVGAVTKALTAPAPPAGPATPKGPAAPTNPAAASLLEEFESRQEESLREQRGRAERRLFAASAEMRKAHPGELRALVEGLSRKVESSPLRAEYIHRVCTGWLRLCSALSLGPRAAGEPAMPGANVAGGPGSMEWRRAHAGFVEIEVDFPVEVNGLAGVGVGRIRVASGPGAARILRQSGRTLGELAVYRRLWLGSQRLDRAPDVVITPDHQLEVNAGSSLLAAIVTGARGRLFDLAVEGRAEELERARLLEKRVRTAPPPARREPGRLGPLLAERPLPAAGERSEAEERRLLALGMRRQLRAAAAQDGASALWAQLGATSTDRLA